jgi:hypothetical protein
VSPRPTHHRTSFAIIRFRREHPDEAFCIRCLELNIRGGLKLSSATTFEIEGLGALRRQGRCSVFGEKRLVAVMPEDPRDRPMW